MKTYLQKVFLPVTGIVGLEVVEQGDNGRVQVKVVHSETEDLNRLVRMGFKTWIPAKVHSGKIAFNRAKRGGRFYVTDSKTEFSILEVGDKVFAKVTDNFVMESRGKTFTTFFVHSVGHKSFFDTCVRQWEERENRLRKHEEQRSNIVQMDTAFQEALPLKKVVGPQTQICEDDGFGEIVLGEPKRKTVPKAPRKKAKPAKSDTGKPSAGDEEENVQATA